LTLRRNEQFLSLKAKTMKQEVSIKKESGMKPSASALMDENERHVILNEVSLRTE